jgi:hypothetical protein
MKNFKLKCVYNISVVDEFNHYLALADGYKNG